MAAEPTVKKRPNCADGTCPPKRAVHAKGCERRAQQLANEDAQMYPWTQDDLDALHAASQRGEVILIPETAENFTIPCCVDGEPAPVKRRPWWKLWGTR